MMDAAARRLWECVVEGPDRCQLNYPTVITPNVARWGVGGETLEASESTERFTRAGLDVYALGVTFRDLGDTGTEWCICEL